MTDLADKFDAAMFDIYQRAKAEARYTAGIFLQMLDKNGGVLTAKTLINAQKPSDGYTALFERNCLHLTVEAVLVDNPEWHTLFTAEEITRARRRLKQYGYETKQI